MEVKEVTFKSILEESGVYTKDLELRILRQMEVVLEGHNVAFKEGNGTRISDRMEC